MQICPPDIEAELLAARWIKVAEDGFYWAHPIHGRIHDWRIAIGIERGTIKSDDH